MPLDATAVAQTVYQLVERHLQRSIEPLTARLAALEARAPERGDKGDPGPVGGEGQRGEQGIPGRDGRDGMPGPSGERGSDGKNGRDGIDGKDGVDGFGFDDLEVEHDGERGFTFRFAREGRPPQEWRFAVPAQIYRGVWVEGQTYVRGDTVTWGGMMFYCGATTNTEKPKETAKSWTLCVKRGADGRDGKAGPRGERGPEGGRGRDLTRLGPDGSKY